ncbi:MFS transporter [Emcibacter nanhaiensis]|uniref:MFS transporter n=1 Tax=Emcibacter nanhaiensis TaxID=1505037 RepID=A0A501PIB9_9PROT|nr:MFS transporter [Emcibacter nanhaiensis]TPD60189.1 MFS transporter [Emcibacter nanhaiensis]
MTAAETKGELLNRPLVVIYLSILFCMFDVASMPVFVGGYVDILGFTVEKAGRIASAEMIAAAVGSVMASLFLSRPGVNLRRVIVVCILVKALMQVVSGTVDQWVVFGGARVISGLTSGLVSSTATVYVASLRKPDRAFAICFGLLSVIGPLGLWFVPSLMASIGLSNVFLLFAASLVLSLLVLRYYPSTVETGRARQVDTAEPVASHSLIGVVLLLSAVLLNFICNGGIWIYAERIGAVAGFNMIDLGHLLSVAMLLGVSGTVLVSIVEDRFGRLLPLVLSHVTLCASILWLYLEPGRTGYFVAITVLNMSTVIVMPYFLSSLAMAKGIGPRAAVMGNAASMIGYGFGPGVLSFFVSDTGFEAAFIVAGSGVILSLILTVGALMLLVRDKRDAAPAIVH